MKGVLYFLLRVLKELHVHHGDFQVFWRKLHQIRTKYLCRNRNAYREQRRRYQLNFLRGNKP